MTNITWQGVWQNVTTNNHNMCPRFQKKKIKQRVHSKVWLLEEACFHAKDRFEKIIRKKEKMHNMTKEETEALSAKARQQWTRHRPRSLPYIPNAYKQPGRATQSRLNSYDSKQTGTVCELSYLFVFILTLLQRHCLKCVFHPEFWGDATETREGLWHAVQRPDAKRMQGASINRMEPNTRTLVDLRVWLLWKQTRNQYLLDDDSLLATWGKSPI